MRHFSLVLAALLLWTPTCILARSKRSDAILLSKVKILTLRDGHETSHRRVDPMPQLTCVGGSARGLYNIDVMRCENAGAEYDAEDIQWTCRASLPPEFKLGSTDVICEGYDNADDPYVLKGSCAVEYRLVLTEKGEEKYRDHLEQSWKAKSQGLGSEESKSFSGSLFTVLFWIIFAAIVFAILYSIFFSNDNGNREGNRPVRRGFNGGGGGPDGYDDPPPPYTPRAPPKAKSYTAQSSRASSSRTANNQQQNAWRPGFWTGAAAGAATGYAAGGWNANRNSRNQAGMEQPRPPAPSGSRGSSWGMGGSSSSSPPTPSSSRQESTGFGGTSRR